MGMRYGLWHIESANLLDAPDEEPELVVDGAELVAHGQVPV